MVFDVSFLVSPGRDRPLKDRELRTIFVITRVVGMKISYADCETS